MGGHAPIEERFWKFVDRGNPTECWLWTGAKNGSGYGHIVANYRSHPAHRVSYQMHKGPIPDGLHILHSCNNPPCVNPAHLRPGTALDNSVDMLLADRGTRILSREQADEIRRLSETGLSLRRIAERMDCDKMTISRILKGETYRI